MIRKGILAKVGGVAVVVASLLWAGGACSSVDKLLEANNPERLDIDALNDPKLVDILVASTVGEFQNIYADPFIWRGSMFTDEQITAINWEQTARLSQRIIRFDEGDANGMFTSMSRARWMADSSSSLLRNLLKTPNSDVRLARTLAYAGYSYIIMAEVLCEATINLSAEIYQPAQLAQFAITRLEEALKVAQAANNTSVANLARVGIARAALLRGDKAKVMAMAGAVPVGYQYWVEYKNNTGREQNTLWNRVTGQNHSIGVHPRFLNGTFGTNGIRATQTDPRIQHTPDWSFGHNRLTQVYKPFQSLPFSGYNGQTIAAGGAPKLYEPDTDIRLAFYVEAMHHYYEAAGATGTGPEGTTLEFVNKRRAVGNQAPVNLSGAALMAELRNQRGRDLYMGGWRLGDLRRWKAQGVGDFFPTGQHPTTQWGNYGDATCFPIPSTEYESNPNIKRTG